MFEEIKQISNDSILDDKLRQAMIKQMEIGYQQMYEINLQIANEWYDVENEAEAINDQIVKGEWWSWLKLYKVTFYKVIKMSSGITFRCYGCRSC